jgi:hypothetical protein
VLLALKAFKVSLGQMVLLALLALKVFKALLVRLALRVLRVLRVQQEIRGVVALLLAKALIDKVE